MVGPPDPDADAEVWEGDDNRDDPDDEQQVLKYRVSHNPSVICINEPVVQENGAPSQSVYVMYAGNCLMNLERSEGDIDRYRQRDKETATDRQTEDTETDKGREKQTGTDRHRN